MTEKEAIETLAGLQKAFRALNQAKAMQAFKALMDTGLPASTIDIRMEFSRALAGLRVVFEEMDKKGIKFS